MLSATIQAEDFIDGSGKKFVRGSVHPYTTVSTFVSHSNNKTVIFRYCDAHCLALAVAKNQRVY